MVTITVDNNNNNNNFILYQGKTKLSRLTKDIQSIQVVLGII